LIGVFPAESSLRWMKVQLYSGATRHSLAAVEGMDRSPQRLVVAASKDEVFRSDQTMGFTAADDEWDVRADDLRWAGYPHSTLTCSRPEIRISANARDAFAWISLPRTLTYWTAFGTMGVESEWGNAEGSALIEHAWGRDSRFNVARTMPRRWHWDVLRFDDGSTCAGLSLFGVAAARSGGRTPGTRFSKGLGLRVRVLDRDAGGISSRWKGRLHLRSGSVTYEARAATPVSHEIPGGGFLGFEFEGSCAGRAVSGTGFTEVRAR